MAKRIVFCDFDGTITAEETFAGMLKYFASRSYDDIKQRIVDRRLSLGAGVRKIVESIPSACFPEVLDYVQTKPLRKGFVDFLGFLHVHHVPFVVISGGLLESVKTRLAPYSDMITAMHAARVDTTGPYLKVSSEYEGIDELVSKPLVTKKYEFDESVAIGDGITDVRLAQAASVVFARDMLTRYLDTKNYPYETWRDFRDIRISLQARWELS